MIEDENCVVCMLLSFGGFLGVGDKRFAIPWRALKPSTKDEDNVFDVPKDRVEMAPGFAGKSWPDLADHRRGPDI